MQGRIHTSERQLYSKDRLLCIIFKLKRSLLEMSTVLPFGSWKKMRFNISSNLHDSHFDRWILFEMRTWVCIDQWTMLFQEIERHWVFFLWLNCNHISINRLLHLGKIPDCIPKGWKLCFSKLTWELSSMFAVIWIHAIGHEEHRRKMRFDQIKLR